MYVNTAQLPVPVPSTTRPGKGEYTEKGKGQRKRGEKGGERGVASSFSS